MLFPLLRLEKATVHNLISWKYSFKRLNEEYEIAKKKKHALDSLYENGRISQATRDSFTNDITAAIAEIEKQQQTLLEKMQSKTHEFEEQIKTLESILANYEIQHVIGEIDEDVYQREINLLSTGLESAKHELDTIREAISQLCPPIAEAPTAPEAPIVPEAPQETAAVVCECHPEEVVAEAAPAAEPVAEDVTGDIPIVPEEAAVTAEPAAVEPEPVVQEPAVTEEMAVPADPEQPPAENVEIVENVEAAPAETVEVPEVVAPVEATETVEAAEVAEPLEGVPETTEMPPTETMPAEETEAAQPAEEAPQIIEEPQQVTEEAAPATEDTTPVIEDTPQIIEEPQVILENPEQTIETPAETIPEETTSIDDPIPAVEEQSKLIEETPAILEETPIEAHPQKAPGEAQPEVILEPISEETQNADEADGVEEASEENVEEEQEV
jgi:hypothetical protein